MQNKTHWKKLTNPDYLGAYALEPGQKIIATIKHVKNEMVIGPDGKKEECIVAHFKEAHLKPMILNATNAKTITKMFKTPYIEEWSNRQIQIYVEKVKAFGDIVEALRIKPTIPTPNNNVQNCADCKGVISPANGMTAQQVSEYTNKKYGEPLCGVCAGKRKAASDENKKIESEDKLNENNENQN